MTTNLEHLHATQVAAAMQSASLLEALRFVLAPYGQGPPTPQMQVQIRHAVERVCTGYDWSPDRVLVRYQERVDGPRLVVMLLSDLHSEPWGGVPDAR